MLEFFARDGDKVGKVARGNTDHREDGRRYGVLAEDVPSDFTDVTGADSLFHLKHFQKDWLQAKDFPSLPEGVVCFDCHIIINACVDGLLVF